MKPRKSHLAFAAISVLPISHAAATPGSPTPPYYGSPVALDVEITDNGGQSTVTINGQLVTPDTSFPSTDASPTYALGFNHPVVPGDLYFTDPTSHAVDAMIRFYPNDPTPGATTSATAFSVFSFSTLNGTPDHSPFDTTVYPAGISAAGGIAGSPSVNIGQTFTAPSGTDDPADTGTYTFTLIPSPEPASAALLGIGATLLLTRRREQKGTRSVSAGTTTSL